MPSPAKFVVSEKIDAIRTACGYDSDAELAKALGVTTATFSTWRKRNTYGSDGEDRLHDRTGADIGWLRNRGETAFPSGPIMNGNISPERMFGDINQIRKALLELVAAMAETTPELALAWRRRLENAASPYYIQHGFHGMLLAVLDSVADSQGAASQTPHVEPAQVTSRRTARK